MPANTEKLNTPHPSALAQGNQALREKDFAQAAKLYLQTLAANPGLAKTVAANLAAVRRNYKAEGRTQGRLRVGVCGWELSHNAAGRAYTLARLYEGFADVEIIGSVLGKYGKSLWEPIRRTATPVHSILVEQEGRFLEQALELVAAHPYDLVHLSKPRAPNILVGILYKLLWGARVVVDIDDEELCFVGCDQAMGLADYLKAHGSPPPLKDLDGPDWTRLAVGLAGAFDGVTVSSPALQKKYGGEIIRHARDERLFKPSPQRRSASREALGIPEGKQVVLFFGTPRGHKGLLETADAIRSLQRGDLVFAVVGDFREPALKERLLQKGGVDYAFLGNQPFHKIPDIVAAGDYCVLMQDPALPVSQFQVPAKLSDALAGGLVVLASDVPPLEEIFACGALVKIGEDGLGAALERVLASPAVCEEARRKGLEYFDKELSLGVNAARLEKALGRMPGGERPAPPALLGLAELLARQHSEFDWLCVLMGQKSRRPAAAEPPRPAASEEAKPLPPAQAGADKVAVVVHYFYPEIWPLIGQRLKALSGRFDLFVTAPVSLAASAAAEVSKDFPQARFQFGPNLGMDIVPFLSLVPTLLNEGYLCVCKLHTKRGGSHTHKEGVDLAALWRDLMLDSLVGSDANFDRAAQAFAEEPELCLAGPAALYQSARHLMYDNEPHLREIVKNAYGRPLPDSDWGFFAGSMFWARTEALAPLARFANFSLKLEHSEYKKDGNFEHAVERAFGLAARLNGGKVGLLQLRSLRSDDCLVAVVDAATAVGKSHITDVLCQLHRLQSEVKTIEDSRLFDGEFYLEQCPELRGLGINLAVHYLTHGTFRGLMPNRRFKPDEYRAAFPHTVRPGTAVYSNGQRGTLEPFVHYINYYVNGSWYANKGANKLQDDIALIVDSGVFDEAYYKRQCPELEGTVADYVAHYLTEGTYRNLYPSKYFIPREYRVLNRDVVNVGVDPLVHYIKYGAKEGRRYRETLRREQVDFPFFRYVVLNASLIDWRRLEAAARDPALASIVIPVHGQGELARACVESILQSPVAARYEIVCVDNASDAGTAATLKRLAAGDPRIRLVSNAENFNFALGCNLGFASTAGSTVVFLNSDATVTPGWLDALLAPLADGGIAAVQPLLLYPDETVQCAGVVFSKHSPIGYPIYAGVPRGAPQVAAGRAFQAVSAACVALRARDFIALRGFDPTFINGQEDVDLCLRLTHATGRRCWCEPGAAVYHHESQSPGRRAHIELNRTLFAERWRGKLAWDDLKYYADDRFKAARWTVDNPEFAKKGIGAHRPVLQKAKIVRHYFTWDKAGEESLLAKLRAVESGNPSFYRNILASVVMPAYNRESIIAAAIDSALAQSHGNIELLVVDDGSTDDTEAAVAKFQSDPRVKYAKIPHAGVSAARNKGLDMASGDYVFYLDTDNTWDADFVRNMLVFLSQEKLEAGYSGIQVVKDDGQIAYYRGEAFDWNECLAENYIDLNAFVHARKLAGEFRFDEKLRRLVDWDFILRITAGHRTAYAPFIGVTYYDGDQNSRITRTEYKGEVLKQMQAAIRAKHHSAGGAGWPRLDASLTALPRRHRVAYVLWDWPALSQTFVLSEIKYFVGLGVDVNVYFKVAADNPATLDFAVAAYPVQDAAHLARLLAGHRRTVIHSPFAYPATTLLTWPASKATGIPFTLMPGGVDISHYVNMKRNRISEVGADENCLGVITIGLYHRDFLIEQGVPSGKIILERQAANLPAFNPAYAPKNARPRVISIGRFIEKKGFKYLVAAAQRLPQMDFVLFGYGPLEQPLREQAAELRLANVSFGGPLESAASLHAEYARADLFALPCVRAADGDMDGLPTVLLEAMASGVPAVSTNVANVPDVVLDGVTGFLCRPGDAEDLARALARAASLVPPVRRRMIDAARRFVGKYASLGQTASTLAQTWLRRTLDIVMVTYDTEKYSNWAETAEIIDRIYRFTSMPFELYVVDNDSQPSFKDALKKRYGGKGNFHLTELERNVYCGPASNAGFAQGASDYIVYVCSKEGFVFNHGWERSMVRAMDAEPGAAIGGHLSLLPRFSDCAEVLNYPSFGKWRSQSYACENPRKKLAHVQGGLFILRRSVFSAAGGFNDGVPQDGMDVEYSYYLESLGYKLLQLEGMASISAKTLPRLGSLVDEHLLAAHPGTLELAARLDRLVARSVKHCNACDWEGEAFLGGGADGRLICPACGADGFARSVFRTLSAMGALQKRPGAVVLGHCVKVAKALASSCPDPIVRQIQTGEDWLGKLPEALAGGGRYKVLVVGHLPAHGEPNPAHVGLMVEFVGAGGTLVLGEPTTESGLVPALRDGLAAIGAEWRPVEYFSASGGYDLFPIHVAAAR